MLCGWCILRNGCPMPVQSYLGTRAPVYESINDLIVGYWAILSKVSCPETQPGPTGLMPEKET